MRGLLLGVLVALLAAHEPLAAAQAVQLRSIQVSLLPDPLHHGYILEHQSIADPNFDFFEVQIRHEEAHRDQTWRLYHPFVKPYQSGILNLPYRSGYFAMRADRPYCLRMRAVYGRNASPWVERCGLHYRLAEDGQDIDDLDLQTDSDQDGVADLIELIRGTDRWDSDSDRDGATDREEIRESGTDPNDIDSDDDGLSDGDELHVYHTNPRRDDSDGDGLSDDAELLIHLSNPNNRDSDDDGLRDGDEVNRHRTNPVNADSDNDGLSDGAELEIGTDPNDSDGDDDGLLDGVEVNGHHSNPRDSDTDHDGLLDGQEDANGNGIVDATETSPVDEDSDNDGLLDGEEVNRHHTNPRDVDSDHDGLHDGNEIQHTANPLNPDTDGDGLLDGQEDANNNGIVDNTETSPINADSDNDGLQDGPEINIHHTDPLNWDTDGDLISDGAEVNDHDTDPLSTDTDGDGLRDDDELRHSADPNDEDTDDDGLHDGDEVHVWGTEPDNVNSDGDCDGDFAETEMEDRDPAFFEAPIFVINRGHLNFGAVNRRGAKRDIILRNNGNLDLELESYRLVGFGYTMADLSEEQRTLAPQEELVLSIYFHPQVAGPADGRLGFLSNDCLNNPGLTMIARPQIAILNAHVEELDLGSVSMWEAAEGTLLLGNLEGNSDLSITLSTDDPAFFVDEPVLTIPAGEERELRIHFRPYRLGVFEHTLTIRAFLDHEQTERIIRLIGRGQGRGR